MFDEQRLVQQTFASSQARDFVLSHVNRLLTRAAAEEFVTSMPATTYCLLCGGTAAPGKYCSHFNAATLVSRGWRRNARSSINPVQGEVVRLGRAYYTALFSRALSSQSLKVAFDPYEPTMMRLEWRGGLSAASGVAIAERLAPRFGVRAYRIPTSADALRAASHLQSALAGYSLPMAVDCPTGDPEYPSASPQVWRCPYREFADLRDLLWFDFKLGSCGTLGECFARLCDGESTVLEALSLNDISRGLVDSEPRVSRFAFDLLKRADGIMAPVAPSLEPSVSAS